MKDRVEMQQLKKMGKRELVRLLQNCDDENRKLAEENEKKQGQIQELKQRLVNLQGQIVEIEEKQKEIQIRHQDPGSLADSMIQVNGVIEAAQSAAKQYLERIREMEAVKQKEAEEAIDMARREAERIISRAKAGAAQIQAAGTNVLLSLQTEIDRMLSGARSEYEQRITVETPVPGAEAYINTPTQPGEEKAEKVPRLNDILGSAAVKRMEETEELAVGQATSPLEPTGEAQPGAEDPAGQEDEFVEGLSEEIKNVINDLTYKTQHLGDTY